MKKVTMEVDGKKRFDVNTPGLIKDACVCCEGRLSPVVWMTLEQLLGMVAERAIELNDPFLNVLMIRLNLYENQAKREAYNYQEIKRAI